MNFKKLKLGQLKRYSREYANQPMTFRSSLKIMLFALECNKAGIDSSEIDDLFKNESMTHGISRS